MADEKDKIDLPEPGSYTGDLPKPGSYVAAADLPLPGSYKPPDTSGQPAVAQPLVETTPFQREVDHAAMVRGKTAWQQAQAQDRDKPTWDISNAIVHLADNPLSDVIVDETLAGQRAGRPLAFQRGLSLGDYTAATALEGVVALAHGNPDAADRGVLENSYLRDGATPEQAKQYVDEEQAANPGIGKSIRRAIQNMWQIGAAIPSLSAGYVSGRLQNTQAENDVVAKGVQLGVDKLTQPREITAPAQSVSDRTAATTTRASGEQTVYNWFRLSPVEVREPIASVADTPEQALAQARVVDEKALTAHTEYVPVLNVEEIQKRYPGLDLNSDAGKNLIHNALELAQYRKQKILDTHLDDPMALEVLKGWTDNVGKIWTDPSARMRDGLLNVYMDVAGITHGIFAVAEKGAALEAGAAANDLLRQTVEKGVEKLPLGAVKRMEETQSVLDKIQNAKSIIVSANPWKVSSNILSEMWDTAVQKSIDNGLHKSARAMQSIRNTFFTHAEDGLRRTTGSDWISVRTDTGNASIAEQSNMVANSTSSAIDTVVKAWELTAKDPKFRATVASTIATALGNDVEYSQVGISHPDFGTGAEMAQKMQDFALKLTDDVTDPQAFATIVRLGKVLKIDHQTTGAALLEHSAQPIQDIIHQRYQLTTSVLNDVGKQRYTEAMQTLADPDSWKLMGYADADAERYAEGVKGANPFDEAQAKQAISEALNQQSGTIPSMQTYASYDAINLALDKAVRRNLPFQEATGAAKIAAESTDKGAVAVLDLGEEGAVAEGAKTSTITKGATERLQTGVAKGLKKMGIEAPEEGALDVTNAYKALMSRSASRLLENPDAPAFVPGDLVGDAVIMEDHPLHEWATRLFDPGFKEGLSKVKLGSYKSRLDYNTIARALGGDEKATLTLGQHAAMDDLVDRTLDPYRAILLQETDKLIRSNHFNPLWLYSVDQWLPDLSREYHGDWFKGQDHIINLSNQRGAEIGSTKPRKGGAEAYGKSQNVFTRFSAAVNRLTQMNAYYDYSDAIAEYMGHEGTIVRGNYVQGTSEIPSKFVEMGGKWTDGAPGQGPVWEKGKPTGREFTVIRQARLKGLKSLLAPTGDSSVIIGPDNEYYREVPNDTKKFGKLAGTIMREPEWNHVVNGAPDLMQKALENVVFRFFTRPIAVFKGSHVAWNAPTIIRNVIQNVGFQAINPFRAETLANFGKTWTDYADWVRDAPKPGNLWQIAEDNGLMGNSFSASELAAVKQEWRARTTVQSLKDVEGRLDQSWVDKATKGYASIMSMGGTLPKFYQWSELFGKISTMGGALDKFTRFTDGLAETAKAGISGEDALDFLVRDKAAPSYMDTLKKWQDHTGETNPVRAWDDFSRNAMGDTKRALQFYGTNDAMLRDTLQNITKAPATMAVREAERLLFNYNKVNGITLLSRNMGAYFISPFLTWNLKALKLGQEVAFAHPATVSLITAWHRAAETAYYSRMDPDDARNIEQNMAATPDQARFAQDWWKSSLLNIRGQMMQAAGGLGIETFNPAGILASYDPNGNKGELGAEPPLIPPGLQPFQRGAFSNVMQPKQYTDLTREGPDEAYDAWDFFSSIAVPPSLTSLTAGVNAAAQGMPNERLQGAMQTVPEAITGTLSPFSERTVATDLQRVRFVQQLKQMVQKWIFAWARAQQDAQIGGSQKKLKRLESMPFEKQQQIQQIMNTQQGH